MKLLPLYLSALTTEQKFSLSGEMLLKGLGTVFLVLLILWGILSLFSVVFGTKPKKPAEKPAPAPKKQEPAPVAKQEPVPAPVAAPAASDDGALIAAITAAIEAYRSAEGGSNLPFRVVSFKRKKNGSAGWSNSAEN